MISSAKEVMFSSAFVCSFLSKDDYMKSTRPVFTKFDGRIARLSAELVS